jgi:hypothetical protein
MVFLIVGFAVGSRVGGQSAPASPVLTPLPTPTDLAAPTATPFPEPIVHLEAVDPTLQQAYYRSGAGFAICVVDAEPSCESHASTVLLTDPQLPQTFTETTWTKMHPFRMQGRAFVAVEALDAASVNATFLEVTSTPGGSLGYDVDVANPGRQGIYYVNVGYQSAGRYLVIVRALVAKGHTQGNTAASYEWQTNLLALDVLPSGQ